VVLKEWLELVNECGLGIKSCKGDARTDALNDDDDGKNEMIEVEDGTLYTHFLSLYFAAWALFSQEANQSARAVTLGCTGKLTYTPQDSLERTKNRGSPVRSSPRGNQVNIDYMDSTITVGQSRDIIYQIWQARESVCFTTPQCPDQPLSVSNPPTKF
jgi:hypothetical protein